MNIYRGDIFYIQNGKGYATGSEQDSGRPAIVVSNDVGNEHAPVVSVVYLTTQEKNQQPTHVKVICQRESTALCEQIYTVSKERVGDFIRTCSDDELKRIDKALAISLGIDIGGIPSPSNVSNKEVEEMRAYITQLKYELDKKNEEVENLSSGSSDTDTIKVSVERELYKNLYEQLLNKLTA